MDGEEGYEDAVPRLNAYGYVVVADGQGFIVKHMTDSNDVSSMRNLDELLDFADLMEWAAQKRGSASTNTPPHQEPH